MVKANILRDLNQNINHDALKAKVVHIFFRFGSKKYEEIDEKEEPLKIWNFLRNNQLF